MKSKSVALNTMLIVGKCSSQHVQKNSNHIWEFDSCTSDSVEVSKTSAEIVAKRMKFVHLRSQVGTDLFQTVCLNLLSRTMSLSYM